MNDDKAILGEPAGRMRSLRFSLLVRAACAVLVAAQIASGNAADSPFLVVPPYLQNVTENGATIVFETAAPARAQVEYGDTPAFGQIAEQIEYGLRVAAGTTVHRIRLDGLRPGGACYYRVTADPIERFGAYKTTFRPRVASAARGFRTADPAASSVSVMVFNDLHENMPLAAQMRRAAGSAAADFTVLLGDCIGDPNTATGTAAIVAGLAAAFEGGSTPLVFMRGNHEARGEYAGRLMERFVYPEGR